MSDISTLRQAGIRACRLTERRGFAAPVLPRLLLCLLPSALSLFSQGDIERQLETAVYRETVLGDVHSAISMYRDLLAQKSIPSLAAARALWQLGQCQEKLGQRREAHASYARLVREFAAETAFAAQARGKLAVWSNDPPGPRNLRFEEGDPGKTPIGWFVPEVEKVNGNLAEVRRKGCRGNGGCAVFIAPSTPASPDAVGNLMQSFSATAYRGKTVRLRAWVRVEGVGPGDRAQMWLRVDRPNGKVGFEENMDGRPVRSADWTSCEIVGEIDNDAQFVVFGVRSVGRGHVWVDEVSFDVVPEEQVNAVRNSIARQYGRTDGLLTSYRFSGSEAVVTVRKATPQGAFTLVETSRDTWERGEAGWKLSTREPLSRGYETSAPDPDLVRTLADEIRQHAVPLNGLESFRAPKGCLAVHRAEMPEGAGEHVFAAVGIPQWVLDLRSVPAGSHLARWLSEPHLFHGQPGTITANCDALVFLEAGAK
ncbi:MAG: hypothetical protein ABI759_11075 [Candidatus Solibacter sp.]